MLKITAIVYGGCTLTAKFCKAITQKYMSDM